VNKKELIKSVADKSAINQKDVTAVLDALIETISDTLKNKDSIALVGFGTFETVERAARVGRNPKTGAGIQIPASISPKFKAGKTLKDTIASGSSNTKNSLKK
jgi:DNA-binding protein HU-beta